MYSYIPLRTCPWFPFLWQIHVNTEVSSKSAFMGVLVCFWGVPKGFLCSFRIHSFKSRQCWCKILALFQLRQTRRYIGKQRQTLANIFNQFRLLWVYCQGLWTHKQSEEMAIGEQTWKHARIKTKRVQSSDKDPSVYVYVFNVEHKRSIRTRCARTGDIPDNS